MGLILFATLDRFVAVGDLIDYLQIRLGGHRGDDSLADQGMIVGD